MTSEELNEALEDYKRTISGWPDEKLEVELRELELLANLPPDRPQDH